MVTMRECKFASRYVTENGYGWNSHGWQQNPITFHLPLENLPFFCPGLRYTGRHISCITSNWLKVSLSMLQRPRNEARLWRSYSSEAMILPPGILSLSCYVSIVLLTMKYHSLTWTVCSVFKEQFASMSRFSCRYHLEEMMCIQACLTLLYWYSCFKPELIVENLWQS